MTPGNQLCRGMMCTLHVASKAQMLTFGSGGPWTENFSNPIHLPPKPLSSKACRHTLKDLNLRRVCTSLETWKVWGFASVTQECSRVLWWHESLLVSLFSPRQSWRARDCLLAQGHTVGRSLRGIIPFVSTWLFRFQSWPVWSQLWASPSPSEYLTDHF